MVTSYFAGWLYWPVETLRALHRDDASRLRAFGIFLGVLELVSAWALIRRLSDEVVAVCCAIVVAASTPYVYVHALLVHYEFVPWMFVGAALLSWFPREGEVTPFRFVLGSLLIGLAVAGNIKTVFLLVPLALYAWAARARPPAHVRKYLPDALLYAAVPLIPLVWFATLDPRRGLSMQASNRFATATRKLFSTALIREPANTLQYWTDVAAYGDVIQNLNVRVDWTYVLPALSFVYVVVHAARAALRKPHDRIAAASGFLIIAYVFVVVFLYEQRPEANYGPLHTVFGVATGTFCVGAGRYLAARLGRGARALPVALSLLAAAGFAYNVVRRGNPAATMELSFNGAAQRAMSAAIITDGAGGDVLTTTYNLAGVPDSFSAGRIRSVQVHPYFARCDQGTEDRASCVEQRWRRLLAMPELRRPLTIVMPVRATMVDEPFAAELTSALERAAASAQLEIARRDEFTTTRGVPVLRRIVLR
jgi:hypothetical protein